MTNEARDTTGTLTTDSAGVYTARNLDPGSYTVEVESNGFSKHVDKGFVLQVSQTARLNVKLTVGSVFQVVEVTTEISPAADRDRGRIAGGRSPGH